MIFENIWNMQNFLWGANTSSNFVLLKFSNDAAEKQFTAHTDVCIVDQALFQISDKTAGLEDIKAEQSVL